MFLITCKGCDFRRYVSFMVGFHFCAGDVPGICRNRCALPYGEKNSGERFSLEPIGPVKPGDPESWMAREDSKNFIKG